MKRKPDFSKDKAFGVQGEADFHAKYPHLTRLDGRRADFAMHDGCLIELKTDSYTASNNFFIETVDEFHLI